ncbi:MAG: OmpA family protein [Ramlibacter sp.]
MKKLNHVTLLFAAAAMSSATGSAFAMAHTGMPAKPVAANGGNAIDNWQNGTGEMVWKNGTNELCWRDATWTPATAAAACDGALVPPPPPAAPAPAVQAPPPPPPPAPAPTPAPQPPAATKVTYAADAFFDFDKAVIKPEGRAKLDDLVGKVKDINLEVIIAVGHTDSIGKGDYNQKLSVKRAEAVKAYLVSKGIEKNRVYTEGKGEKQPVADNKTSDGRAKNRRVEIEVVGTRATR